MIKWQNGFLGVSKAAALGWARGPGKRSERRSRLKAICTNAMRSFWKVAAFRLTDSIRILSGRRALRCFQNELHHFIILNLKWYYITESLSGSLPVTDFSCPQPFPSSVLPNGRSKSQLLSDGGVAVERLNELVDTEIRYDKIAKFKCRSPGLATDCDEPPHTGSVPEHVDDMEINLFFTKEA